MKVLEANVSIKAENNVFLFILRINGSSVKTNDRAQISSIVIDWGKI